MKVYFVYPGNLLLGLMSVLTFFFMWDTVVAQEHYLPDNPLSGQELFSQKGCIKCHAIRGQGGTVGPDLSSNLFYGSYLELAGIMWNHAPEMHKRAKEMDIQIEQLTEDEMASLIAYISYMHYLGQEGNEFRGRKVLERKKCYACHKIAGKGKEVGPDLSKLTNYVSPLYIAQAMWNHGPEIVKQLKAFNMEFVEFENDEIIDLTAAIKSFSNPKIVKSEYMQPGNSKNGKKLFVTKGCIRCHSINGRGGNVGPSFTKLELKTSVTGIAGIMWNHGPKMWELMKKQKLERPTFSTNEIADIIAYLFFIRFNDTSGDPVEGEKVFANKGCLNCHAVRGKGLSVGPDLTSMEKINTSGAMIQIMWNHASVMIEKVEEQNLPWPKFHDNNMADLYAYLQLIQQQPSQPQ